MLDVDDPFGAVWAKELRAAGKAVTTFAIDAPADLRARDVHLRPDGSSFQVGDWQVELPLPGRFNVQNALCALGIVQALDAISPLPSPRCAAFRRFRVAWSATRATAIVAIVDYAHTPDALANVLRAARETISSTAGRLFVVFGCGGDRDAGKRPEMGSVARELADVVIVTNDNPRSEDPEAIAREIVAGVPDAQVELDRRTAIRDAIGRARAGDVVVIAGKGHEDYQIVGHSRTHFDDRDEVRSALALRAVPG